MACANYFANQNTVFGTPPCGCLEPVSQALGQCFDLESKGGGGKRDRTDDPLLAKQVLYQLSYAPFKGQVCGGSGRT